MFDNIVTAILGPILVLFSRFGLAAWGWRVVRLLHALPYLGAAYLWGWFSVWLWGVPISPHYGAALCAGVVLAGMCWSWLKDWRRGSVYYL